MIIMISPHHHATRNCSCFFTVAGPIFDGSTRTGLDQRLARRRGQAFYSGLASFFSNFPNLYRKGKPFEMATAPMIVYLKLSTYIDESSDFYWFPLILTWIFASWSPMRFHSLPVVCCGRRWPWRWSTSTPTPLRVGRRRMKATTDMTSMRRSPSICWRNLGPEQNRTKVWQIGIWLIYIS